MMLCQFGRRGGHRQDAASVIRSWAALGNLRGGGKHPKPTRRPTGRLPGNGRVNRIAVDFTAGMHPGFRRINSRC